MTDEIESKEPKKKMVKVKLITDSGNTVIVEYMVKGRAIRVMLPMTDLVNGAVEEKKLEAGFSYGVPWETVELPSFTAQDLADELHKYDIWTADDALKNIRVIQGVVANLTGKVVQQVIRLSNQYKSNN